MQRPNRRAVLAAALGTMTTDGGVPLAVRRARARGPVRFGLTPVFLDSDLELLRDLEGYLVRALGAGVQLVKRRTYQEIMALLLSGQLDAAWVCGYPYVQHADRLALSARSAGAGGGRRGSAARGPSRRPEPHRPCRVFPRYFPTG